MGSCLTIENLQEKNVYMSNMTRGLSYQRSTGSTEDKLNDAQQGRNTAYLEGKGLHSHGCGVRENHPKGGETQKKDTEQEWEAAKHSLLFSGR